MSEKLYSQPPRKINFLALGAGAGMIIGAGVGFVLGNVDFGMGLGVVVGAVLGSLFNHLPLGSAAKS